MKKAIALLSALTMITAFVGCSSNEDGSSSEAESTTTVAETTETTTAITTKIEPATTTNSPEDFELGMPFKLGNMSADMPTNLLYYEQELDSGTMAYYWRSNEWIIQIYNEPILNSDTDAEYLLTLDIAFGEKEDYEKKFSTIDDIGCLVVKTKANNQVGYTIALNGQCYSIIFTCTNTSDIENIVKPIVDSIKFDKTKATTKTDANVTLGMKNAVETAKRYIKTMPFSYTRLIEQLEYEKYSHEEAVYGADNCGADWNEQAVLSAKSYIKSSAFSYLGLIGQLEYEGFTNEEAIHGADNCNADWNEQAAKCAESYINSSSFSRQELLNQLLYEEFTADQAEYGVSAVGY